MENWRIGEFGFWCHEQVIAGSKQTFLHQYFKKNQYHKQPWFLPFQPICFWLNNTKVVRLSVVKTFLKGWLCAFFGNLVLVKMSFCVLVLDEVSYGFEEHFKTRVLHCSIGEVKKRRFVIGWVWNSFGLKCSSTSGVGDFDDLQ